MKKYLIIGLFIVFGVGMSALVMHNRDVHENDAVLIMNTPDNTLSTATIDTLRIVTNKKGFSPDTLTISQGDTVTFINDDTEKHWPASDIHPSHSIYPEFDPKRPMVPGEKWSFTFDKVGTWRMHDHLHPSKVGTITVLGTKTGKAISTTTLVATTTPSTPCDISGTDFYCIEKYYQELVKSKGVDTAMKDLDTRYKDNVYIRSQCHPITHVIGRAAVDLYPRVSEAYSHGNSLCWSGYYHGVMEGIIDKIGVDKILREMPTICNDIPGKEAYSFDYYNCVHGLGHGLMALTENELFRSLELCDSLVGSWEQSSCYGGVFMENVIVDNKNHFTKYLKPEEPLYPCNAVKEQYKSSCYLMQTSYMLKVVQNDFAKVFPLCRSVESPYVAICFQSLGRDASGQSVSDVIRTKAICDLGVDDFEKSNCLIGAVKDFVSYFHSDVQAKDLCSRFDTELKRICTDTVTSYYSVF